MIVSPLLAIVLLAQASSPAPAPDVTTPVEASSAVTEPARGPIVYPEVGVTRVLEDLRKSELMLDAAGLEVMVAASLTVVEDGMRVAGSFAFVEPIRRMRERGGVVKELQFTQSFVKVYGGSGMATYRYAKTWTDQGARRHDEGWCTDVFERREDGAWILVLRHRASDRPTRIQP